MSGFIQTGENYQSRALSGFMREGSREDEIIQQNMQLQAAKKGRSLKMAGEGAGIGYKAGPGIVRTLTPAGGVTADGATTTSGGFMSTGLSGGAGLAGQSARGSHHRFQRPACPGRADAAGGRGPGHRLCRAGGVYCSVAGR